MRQLKGCPNWIDFKKKKYLLVFFSNSFENKVEV